MCHIMCLIMCHSMCPLSLECDREEVLDGELGVWESPIPHGLSHPLDAGTDLFDLACNTNANFTYNWTAIEVGSHYFEFTLELANQSATDNDNASMVVSVRAPVAEVVPGLSTTVGEASVAAYAMAAIVAGAAALFIHRWRRILRGDGVT